MRHFLAFLLLAVPITKPSQIKFKQNGTGAVERTLASRLGDQISVLDFGAVCNGVTDDLAALNLAVAALPSGGELWLPNSRCLITSAWLIQSANISIRGSGPSSEIYLDSPGGAFPLDRAVYIVGNMTALRPITGSIALGATTFTATNGGSDTSDLSSGDWIQVEELDANIGEVIYFDFIQISSVAGGVVTPRQPFREAFPNNQQVNFRKFTNSLGGNALRDFKVTTRAGVGGNGLVGVVVEQARDITIDNMVVDSGKSLVTYRTQGVTFRNCRQTRSTAQTSEFAASVDLTVQGNVFLSDYTTAGVSIDVGTGFFDFSGNKVYGLNAGINLLYNVHDGTVTNNTVAFVKGSAQGSGIVGRGVRRVAIVNNNLNGGAGYGISLGTATTMSFPITSSDNFIMGNSIQNFALGSFDALVAADTYIMPTAPLTATTFTANAGSGSDGLNISTYGARLRLGAAASNYFYSDATYIYSANTNGFRSAGPFISDGGIFNVGGSTTAFLRGNQVDGASAVGVVIENNVTLANATAKLTSVRNNGTEKLAVDLNGKFISPTGGAADVAGRAVLAGNPSIILVSTAAVTATSVIELTRCAAGGTAGSVYAVSAIVAATSFTIASYTSGTSASTADTSTICWAIRN